MSFQTLAGNRILIQRLARMARTGSVPPSLLLTGPPGVGKLEAAITLAKALNCLENTGDSCDRCPACVRAERGEHPDVRILRPEGKGAQHRIDGVRKLVNEIPFRPFEGRRRVAVFADCERMNSAAANALLKTLEEPPPWAVLVLVIANASSLLPTILSRCQTYRFAPLDVEDVTKRLVEQHGHDPSRARLLAALSSGSVDRALAFAEESVEELRAEALAVAKVVADGASEHDLVRRADSLSKNPELSTILQLTLGLMRDVAVAGNGGTVVHRDLSEPIAELGERAPVESWVQAYVASEKTLSDLRDRYLNKRIAMSQLLLGLARSRRSP